MIGLLVFNVSEQLANKSGRKFVQDNKFSEFQRLIDSAEGRNFESFESRFENVIGEMPKKMIQDIQRVCRKYSNENFENFNDDDFENLIAQMPAKFAPKIMQAIGKNPGLIGNAAANSYKAQFDFKITRVQTSGTKAIPHDLPIHIFNPLNFNNQFSAFLTGLPAGVSVVVSVVGNDLSFAYTLGSDIDTITIHGVTEEYVTMLAGFMHAEFTVNKLRLSSTIANYAAWFAQSMSIGRKTVFGKLTDLDNLPFVSQKSPIQQDPTILDLDVNLHFQNDKGLTYTVPQVFNEPLTISVFVSAFILK